MLGLVTIGQSPRDDVVRSMFGGDAPPLVQAGALDELDDAAIATLAPEGDEHLLVTRLRDGREVTVGKPRLLPHVRAAVARVERAGADVVCVACTGEFPTLSGSVRVIFPDKLLSATVDALAPDGALGVLMPHDGQREMMRRKWSRPGRALVLASASPYLADDALGRAAARLAQGAPPLIVMDCMGFDRAMQARVRAACGVPTLLANGLVGAILRELGGSGGHDFEQAPAAQALHVAGG